MKQTVENACGTIGFRHAMENITSQIKLMDNHGDGVSDGIFNASTATLSIGFERSHALSLMLCKTLPQILTVSACFYSTTSYKLPRYLHCFNLNSRVIEWF